MNEYKLFIGAYGRLYNRPHIPGCLLAPFRYWLRKIANRRLPQYFQKHEASTVQCAKTERQIIVSLTSFPKRVGNLWLVIETLLRQTVVPNKIILWLSKDQFPEGLAILPDSLKSQQNDVFEIRFVEGDIRSHKKYLYAFREYPNEYVITVDDDIMYPTTMIESLLKSKAEHPENVICRYGFIMQYDKIGNTLGFSKWIEDYEKESVNFCFGSGGGTLFVPKDLYEDVTNIEIALKLAPLADDLWLNAMTFLAGAKNLVISKDLLMPVLTKGNERLCDVNVGANKNDEQLFNIIDYYTHKLGVNPFAKQI